MCAYVYVRVCACVCVVSVVCVHGACGCVWCIVYMCILYPPIVKCTHDLTFIRIECYS